MLTWICLSSAIAHMLGVFHWDLASVVDGAALGDLDLEDLQVLPYVRCLGSGVFIADGEALAFEYFVGGEVASKSLRREDHKTIKTHEAATASQLLEFPWLSQYLPSASSSRPRNKGAPQQREEPEELEEDEVEAAIRSLAQPPSRMGGCQSWC